MRILLLDIETTPNKAYVWGLFKQNVATNQIVETGRTMCWAAKWLGDKKIHFSSWDEEDMIHKIHGLLEDADAIVTYNGKKFDIPTLNREFLMERITPPSTYKHIDLYHTVRSAFRFVSNKLDFVCQQLGLGGKTEHNGMELWTACMDGDPSAWRLMKRYNRNDVVLLESLYEKVLPWIKSHPNHNLYSKADDILCTNCGGDHLQRRGFAMTSAGKYQRYQCQDCGSWCRGRTTQLDSEEKETLVLQAN